MRSPRGPFQNTSSRYRISEYRIYTIVRVAGPRAPRSARRAATRTPRQSFSTHWRSAFCVFFSRTRAPFLPHERDKETQAWLAAVANSAALRPLRRYTDPLFRLHFPPPAVLRLQAAMLRSSAKAAFLGVCFVSQFFATRSFFSRRALFFTPHSLKDDPMCVCARARFLCARVPPSSSPWPQERERETFHEGGRRTTHLFRPFFQAFCERGRRDRVRAECPRGEATPRPLVFARGRRQATRERGGRAFERAPRPLRVTQSPSLSLCF